MTAPPLFPLPLPPFYVELHCHSYYSLCDGASSPEALLDRAVAVGLPALALTDHDNLYGAVRFWCAAQERNLRAIIGAEVTTTAGHLTLLAETQAGYTNLCRLITQMHLGGDAGDAEAGDWPGKGAAALTWEALDAHRHGLIVLTGCRHGPLAAPLLAGQPGLAKVHAGRLREIFGPKHLFVELQRHLLPDEPPLLRGLIELARRLGLPVVATNNVHYAERSGRRLQDVLVCIEHLTSLDEAGERLRPNSEYHLKAAADMARLFPGLPDALSNSLDIAERCHANLDFSGQRLPAFPVPAGHTAFSYLYDLCQGGLHRKYQPVTPAASRQLAYELDVIERAGLSGYFLVVWDIVCFARNRGIRCQGRGSAAGSLVAYVLDISPVDPLHHNLLFDRFLSPDRRTMPDIDIDFAADRREEVIQYVYGRYGPEHVAMVCNVNTFQARSALRDVGRALGLQAEMIEVVGRRQRISSAQSEGAVSRGQESSREVQPALAESEKAEGAERMLLELCAEIAGVPRHLSIHVGGMLITANPLHEIVPLERATMPGRVVAQWDKDSVEDAGLIKIDLLGLRTLGMVDEIAHLVEARSRSPDRLQTSPPLARLTLDDPAVYAALSAGDTLGAFQVESRAQTQMLPRLQPRCFEDIVIEVAIVRPGPIQGNMVHPYLRRRQGLEAATYLHPSLEPVLGETLGVILFQEQVLRVAMTIAGFSGGEADQFRRALSRSRSPEELRRIGQRFVSGAASNGVGEEAAAVLFGQLAGFASYGFCKSHAAAFALLAYQTMWLKLNHPREFYTALLNQQPMGFYTPAVIVGDAKRHGVIVLPPDINRSQDACTLEENAIRLGLRFLKGVGPAARQRVLAGQPFAGLRDLCQRTRLPHDAIEALIRAGALDSLDLDRRRLLWELGMLDYRPLVVDLDTESEVIALPELQEAEAMAWSLDLLGMTPGDHVIRLYRPYLQSRGILSAAELEHQRDGEMVKVAGQVVVRQSPPTAKGHLFLTLEDETGLANLIVRPALYAKRYEALRYAPLLAAAGRVQREGEACSVLVQGVWEISSG